MTNTKKGGRVIKPFGCDEPRLYALAGDILYTGANEYKLAGLALRRLERAKELHYYDAEFEDDALIRKEENEYLKEFEEYLAERSKWSAGRKAYRKAMREYESAVSMWETMSNAWLASGGYGEPPEKPAKPCAPKAKEPKPPVQKAHVTPPHLKIRTPLYKASKQRCESVMNRERAFILSDRFQILLGRSEHTGRSILHELDRFIAEYDPTPYMPELDPKTGEPYPMRAWRRILDERSKANGQEARKGKKAKG